MVNFEQFRQLLHQRLAPLRRNAYAASVLQRQAEARSQVHEVRHGRRLHVLVVALRLVPWL